MRPKKKKICVEFTAKCINPGTNSNKQTKTQPTSCPTGSTTKNGIAVKERMKWWQNCRGLRKPWRLSWKTRRIRICWLRSRGSCMIMIWRRCMRGPRGWPRGRRWRYWARRLRIRVWLMRLGGGRKGWLILGITIEWRILKVLKSTIGRLMIGERKDF